MDCKNIIIGGVSDVRIGALSDTFAAAQKLGATDGGVTISTEATVKNIMVDQSVQPVRGVITEQHVKVALPFKEITTENLEKAFSAVMGSNGVFAPDVENYFHVWVVTKGPKNADGSDTVRVYDFPKVKFDGNAEISLSRTDEQVITMTGEVYSCPDADGNIAPFSILSALPA